MAKIKREAKISPFDRSVYALTARIPKGKVSTYGKIARKLGKPGASRAVGQALNRNPWAPQIPCHRVISSNGDIGGFAGGKKQKIKLLKQEGVKIGKGRINLDRYEFLM